MKKYINFLLVLFICFNCISTTYSFSYYKTTSEKSENVQIAVKQDARASEQKIKYLAVFIEFSDNTNKNHIDDQKCIENAEKIFNSELFDMDTVNGIIKVPSFKKYYEMQSYGKLSITTEIFPKVNGKVVSYVDSHPIGYYLKYNENNPIGYKNSNERMQREGQLVNSAVTSIAKQIEAAGIKKEEIDADNNGTIDAISFFVEGQSNLPSSIAWGDLLWSHMSNDKEITQQILGKKVGPYNLIYVNNYEEAASVFSLNRGTYGTIIHEFGHTIGYMDLYRHNSSENKPVGFYDIMGNAIGSNPQNFLTYFISEYHMQNNWHKPLPIVEQTSNNITLFKPEFKDENEMRAIKIQPYVGSKEYFIVEYHEKQNTYENYCADESGIIVYRVNDTHKYSGNVSGRRPWRK
ncbi:MAG: hypothetical protein HFJ28_02565 [Clostridia bacterium]|jgi:M6 family metalloprotease-like protein|nr:hypothetical protein [Clostridia bacterium]